jgi:stress-induced morphogen
MSIKKSELERLIAENFPNSQLEVIDTVGDEDHYRIKIASPEFEGLTRIAKHRLINSRLKDYIGTKIHAIEFVIGKI